MPPGAALPSAGDAGDGLPEWLRPLQSGVHGSPPSGQLPPPPAGPRNPVAPYNYNQQPGYNQQPSYNQSGAPANGFGQAPQQGPQWQQAQQGQQGPQHQFSMGSLVSEDALPEWLRQGNTNLAPQGQPSPGGWGASGGPAQAAQPQYNSFGAAPIPPTPSPYGGPRQNGPAYGYGASGGPAYGAGGMPQSHPLPSSPYGQMQLAAPQPGAINAGVPASSFFDESALPEWMRQAAAQSGAPGASPQQQAPQAVPYQQMPGGPGMGYGSSQGYQPPSQPAPAFMPPQPMPQPPSNAFPSIDRAGAFQPAPAPQGGMAGQSLLDSGALPNWLGGSAGAAAQGGHGGAANSIGMAAQSLVDESALPQWLRAQPDAPTPAAPAAQAFGAPAPAQAGGWGAAPAPDEPLPAWLSQVYVDAKVPRTDTLQQQASANPWGANGGYRSSVSGPLAGGFGAGRTSGTPQSEASGVPASQFVDESALPEWLRAQGAAPTSSGAIPPASPLSPVGMPGPAPMPASDGRAIPAYVPPASAGTPGTRAGMSFSASDLIDPDVLPQWVRPANGASAGSPPSQQATFSSAGGWTNHGPAVPGSGILPPPPTVPGSGVLPPPPAASWRQPGMSDQLPAWQSNEASDQGSSHSYAVPPSRSEQLSGGGGKRLGGGIPADELPPWLQQADAGRAPNHAMEGSGQRMAEANHWDRAPQQQAQDVWDDGNAEAGGDFAWDENQYAADDGYDSGYGQGAQNDYGQNAYDPNAYDQSGYDPNAYDPNAYDPNAYDAYDYDAPPEADERSGGWRRLFGRR